MCLLFAVLVPVYESDSRLCCKGRICIFKYMLNVKQLLKRRFCDEQFVSKYLCLICCLALLQFKFKLLAIVGASLKDKLSIPIVAAYPEKAYK